MTDLTMRVHDTLIDRAQSLFEVVVVRVLQLFLAIVIVTAIVEFATIIYDAIAANLLRGETSGNRAISTVPDLQRVVQRAFAAVLLVILGLELLETLRTFFSEHGKRLRIIIVVALIAVSRHIIQMDFEHLAGDVILGISALVLALAASYYLIVRVASSPMEDSAHRADERAESRTKT